MAPLSIHHFRQAKQAGRPLVALTAADCVIAQILDTAGIDLILVGDSLAMTSLGYSSTLPLTLEEMLHHAQAVRRGVERAFLVADLPFLTYQVQKEQALVSAGRLMKEAGMNGVKLEGGYPDMAETVAFLVQRGIPVLGHIGLTPQAKHQLGGYRQQGKTSSEAERLQQEAQSLEQAGAFALVLEHIPWELAARITEQLRIPTLGIGAGPACDGQILVTHDLLGLGERIPPFAKAYTNLRQVIREAVEAFMVDVQKRAFPPT
ncbi:MAG: 3-methyl-2-oxobutanoate hydroxymethyltransferase [Thermostichus sp. DRC_bins_24]